MEYSLDEFENILCSETVSNKVDFFNLSGGSWQWRVKAVGEGISNTEEIPVSGSSAVQKLVSESTVLPICWSAGYATQHTGILNGWGGTHEKVALFGKNKLADIFEGSADSNILVMTDDSNGDALFVDDIYTT